MKQSLEFQIGGGELMDTFLSDIEMTPNNYKSVILVSPFVEFCEDSLITNRIKELSISVSKNGGTVKIISDMSDARIKAFRRLICISPELDEKLELCKYLHAKCAYALNWCGSGSAYLGSSNFTKNGFRNNVEAVILIRNVVPGGKNWTIFCEIKEYIDNLFKHSIIYKDHLRVKRRLRCNLH